MIVLGALALAACAQHGTGPLTLSPAVSEGYSGWLYTERPMFFAVSKDGQTYSAGHCTSSGLSGGCDSKRARQEVLQDCSQRAAGKICYIYADSTGVVWDGPVSVGAR